MAKRFVRVHPRSGQTAFFRCGIKFSLAWLPVDVDDATAKRLEAEQMLEVSETRPADMEGDDQAGDSAVATPNAGTVSGTPVTASDTGATVAKPDDSAKVALAILAAINQLDKEDSTLWTTGGKPKTEAITAITGWPVTAAERDAALAVDE